MDEGEAARGREGIMSSLQSPASVAPSPARGNEYQSPLARRALTRGPLVHSPLGHSPGGVLQSMQRATTPDAASKLPFTPPSAMKTPPYAHSEYEGLWREAEDRAAALSVELKFLKEKEKRSKQDVETQKKLLRKAAAEVKQEALEMRERLGEAKERELELDLLKLDLSKTQKQNADLGASLEEERTKVAQLVQLEEKDESAHASSSEMYSEKVQSLEESLMELSGKLKELSSAELDEPYPPPQEMKSNHVWQQATNAAKARSRGQRAAAFAGQARAEARVSSLQRELDSQLRRNIALEKGLQIAKVKSLSNEERLESEGKNLMTMSQELEGISKKYHETEALCTDLKDATENFNSFITQTKELATSLLSDIEPIQTDEDYADSIEISMESETEDSEVSSSDKDKSQYTKAFSLLASAVRKAKAAMKYTKASNRAQLQAKEVALSEAHAEREMFKEEKETLTNTISELKNSNDDLQSNVSELQNLLESSTNEKQGSIIDIEEELQESNKAIADLVTTTKDLKGQKASLERKLFSVEKEKRSIQKELESKQENFERLREEAFSTAKDLEGSIIDIEQELQESNKTVNDLVTTTKDLEGQKASLERKLFSVEKEKRSIQKELELKQGKFERLREEASSNEDAAAALIEEKAALSDELSNLKRNTEVRVSDVEKKNLDMTKELRIMEAHNESLQNEFDSAMQVHRKRVKSFESDIAGKKALAEEWKDKVESSQMLTDELNRSIADLKTRLEGSMLESAAKGAELESTKADASRLEAELNDEIAKKENDLIISHDLRLELERDFEQGNRKLKSEMEYLREEISRKAAEQDETDQEIVHLKESLHKEQQKRSKQGIEIEQLNAYITTLKIEMEKYIEMLTSSNAEKNILEEKLEELEDQMSIRTVESKRKNSEVEECKIMYEEQLGLLKENLERKNEQIKLYGTGCRDMLTSIKESFAIAFDQGAFESNDSEGQNLDLDMGTYMNMKKLSSEVFPLLRTMVEDDKETIKRVEEDMESAKEDLENALSREMRLQRELENAKSECNTCAEERDTFRTSADLFEGQVVELKKILEDSAIKVTETEASLQCKASELSHLHEELESVQKQQQELHHIIDLFKEAEIHFFNLFLAMEHQLNKVGDTAATCRALLVDANITKTPLTLMKEIVEEIKSLEESCKQQKEIISAHTGRGGFKSFGESTARVNTTGESEQIMLLKEELLFGSRIIKSSSNSSRSVSKAINHNKRPWWQRALILPVRLLPAVALIGASSGKSNELRSAVRGFIKAAKSPSKVKKRQLLGGKPYTNSTAGASAVSTFQQTHDLDFTGVPTTGTRQVDPQ